MKQFLALKASAGSGKTYALTLRYISLLFLDINPNTILTLTFTNKAASEMSERIFKTLIALGDDINILKEISKQTNLEIASILNKKDQVLDRFLTDELFIITLDKFINKILREFAGYLDISDDFKIENDDYDLMLYKFLLSLNSEAFHNLIDFSHTNSKKLNAIIELFESLDDKNHNFTLIDFSFEILEGLQYEIIQSAFLIKDFVMNSELSQSARNAVNFNDIDSLLECGKTWLSKESLCEYSYFKKVKPSTALDTHLFSIQSNLQLYFKYKEIGVLNGLFTIYNHFKEFRYKYKKEKNSLQFNDITNLVYQLFQRFLDKDFLYFRLDAKYDHILIDEFQDTSIMQYKILQPLIEEVMAGSVDFYKTFFYVGDTKQSIYRFRGGRKELFDYVLEDSDGLVDLEVLDINYRSAKNIVNFVNSIFLNLPLYEYYEQKAFSSTEGFVEIVTISSEEDIGFGFIKEKIVELFDAGISANNIAILTYTNSDVLAVYEYLKSELPDIKIVTDMTSKLINQKNVKAVIELIKYFYFNEDIYRVNFNSILGEDLDNKISLDVDLDRIDLITIVKMIGTYYQLIEENLLKFIEVLSSYDDITDFVYEVDKNDTPMVNSDSVGLQILTIFKSKGLEFDTVLLLDRMKNKNIDKSPLLFSYEEITLRKIYYKEKLREQFDMEYKNAIEKEKALNRDDELNVLYVAITRAEHNMIIFKKGKNSVFDVLEKPIEDCNIGSLVVEKSKTKESLKEIASYSSMILGEQAVEENKTKGNSDDLKSRYFGIATHYCLEMMKKFDISSLQFALQFTKNKYSHILSCDEFEDLEKRIRFLLKNEQFISLIKDAHFTKEQSLVFNEELKIIDLLIEKEDHYIILDYKTTHQEEEIHKDQVKSYMRYIKSITQKDILGYLIYLHSNEITIRQVV